jgi:hypothetical protein
VFLNCLGEHFFLALRRVHGDQAVLGIPIAELTVAVTSPSPDRAVFPAGNRILKSLSKSMMHILV